jgi:two-component sensor histidine kinase
VPVGRPDAYKALALLGAMSSFQPRLGHRLILAAIAGGGIALSAILAIHFSNMRIEETRYRLVVGATGFADDLEQYLRSREMIATTVGSIFDAPDLSQPRPLRLIGKPVLALTPDISLIAWIPQVDASRIQDVLNGLSSAGRPPRLYGPNFQALEVADTRRTMYPVVDVEPKLADNQVGLGIDLALFPARRAAFEKARDEKRTIATAPMQLLQPFNSIGYALYSPIYNDHGFVGCLMFLYRVDQLLTGFVRARRIPMNFRVYDATDPGQPNYLIALTRHGEIEAIESSVRLDDASAMQHSLDFAGRKILVAFDPAPDLDQVGIHEAIIIGSFGLLLTGLMLWVMYYFMRSSRRLAFEIDTNNLMKASLELVNRELNHRVGNLLAVAQGIIGLSYNTSLSMPEFREAITGRLNALHKAIKLINREDWKGVGLHELLQVELASVMDRIDVSGRDAFLKSKAAQSLSLLFYELMTNSTKHGALSTRDGRVTVGWEVNDSGSGRLFCFRWQEHNDEITTQPTRQGFGTTLLTRLVPADLSGRATLDYASGSFRYELEAPVEAVIEQESNAVENVKGISTMHVIRERPDPKELLT